MSKDWKEIGNVADIGEIADSIFIKVDAIWDRFDPYTTRNTTITIGNKKATFTDSHIVVLNPKLYAENAQQDAWEIARKVYTSKENGGFSLDELREIFGDGLSISDIYGLPFKEVAAKIEAREEKKKISLGDIVVRKVTDHSCDGNEFLVTKVMDDFIWGISRTGMTFAYERANEFVKTGSCFGSIPGFLGFFDEGSGSE